MFIIRQRQKHVFAFISLAVEPIILSTKKTITLLNHIFLPLLEKKTALYQTNRSLLGYSMEKLQVSGLSKWGEKINHDTK